MTKDRDVQDSNSMDDIVLFQESVALSLHIANCELVSPFVKIKDNPKMFQHQTSKTMKTLCSKK